MNDLDTTFIVKEGYMFKRGEYIKNWRQRYFFLLSDGRLVGYKNKPDDGPTSECYNLFYINNCRVMKRNQANKFLFLIRCLDYTKHIDRLFRCDSSTDRDEWVDEIIKIGMNQNVDKVQYREVVENDDLTIGQYKLLKILGEGSFGKVILAQNTNTGVYVAIKVMNKEKIYDHEEVGHIESEGRILRSFVHPFLISMIDYFQTKERIYFVMNFLNGGELFYHLKLAKRFSESRTKFYAAEVILALQFLHSEKVTYRDLKLENTILDSEGHVKLCDFGLCKENTTQADFVTTFCGTREYIAPEIIRENAKGYSIDWWCLGVFIFECLTCELPFSNSKVDKVLYDKILNSEVDLSRHHFSNNIKHLIFHLLIKNPKQRLGCSNEDGEDIKNHAVFSELNWDDVLSKRVKPEFVPQLSGPADTRFFNETILNTPIKFSPSTRIIDYDLKF